MDAEPPPAVAGSSGAVGMQAASAPATTALGIPCLRGETQACTCEAGGDGHRTCIYDDSSPLEGFLSDCARCTAPPPDPAEQCSDGEKNGLESDTDCGGAVCDPCLEGGACTTTSDCADAECVDSTCTVEMPATGGSGGSGGSAGAGSGGTAGDGEAGNDSGGSTADEPVRSCLGERLGTPCDRDCLLPGNEATCNLFGICSCL